MSISGSIHQESSHLCILQGGVEVFGLVLSSVRKLGKRENERLIVIWLDDFAVSTKYFGRLKICMQKLVPLQINILRIAQS